MKEARSYQITNKEAFHTYRVLLKGAVVRRNAIKEFLKDNNELLDLIETTELTVNFNLLERHELRKYTPSSINFNYGKFVAHEMSTLVILDGCISETKRLLVSASSGEIGSKEHMPDFKARRKYAQYIYLLKSTIRICSLHRRRVVSIINKEPPIFSPCPNKIQ